VPALWALSCCLVCWQGRAGGRKSSQGLSRGQDGKQPASSTSVTDHLRCSSYAGAASTMYADYPLYVNGTRPTQSLLFLLISHQPTELARHCTEVVQWSFILASQILQSSHCSRKRALNVTCFTLPSVGGAKYCDDRVCLFVSLCVCLPTSIYPELHIRSSPNFLCMLLMPIARSFSGGIAILYALPVLYMTTVPEQPASLMVQSRWIG